jgi:hypothetical protein
MTLTINVRFVFLTAAALVVLIAFPVDSQVILPEPRRVQYVERWWRNQSRWRNVTLTRSQTKTRSQHTPSLSYSESITTKTPPLTVSKSLPSLSLTGSDGRHTLSPSLSLSLTPTSSWSLTITFPSHSLSDSLQATPTLAPTLTEGVTDTRQLTTSALPATTSEKVTASRTLRTRCPECGNGVCNNATLKCECYFDTRLGHWAGGEVGAGCSVCAAGYYGATCMSECPGSPCNACFGHGSCDDGLTGTGTCTCYHTGALKGSWNGSRCDECADGWFGVNCTKQCPCTGAGTHGRCDSGRFATGECVCDDGWSGAACNVCNASKVALCVRCPDSCSGHGQCNSIDGGFEGVCVCDEFYSGPSCKIACPGFCSGVGKCFDGASGNGSCACPANHQEPACDSCLDEWWGVNCTMPCDCSGNGRCRRSDGVCECVAGYIGTRCEMACLRTAEGICGGHGRCVGSGQCSCIRSSENGYWGSATCAACASGYSGPTCQTACLAPSSTASPAAARSKATAAVRWPGAPVFLRGAARVAMASWTPGLRSAARAPIPLATVPNATASARARRTGRATAAASATAFASVRTGTTVRLVRPNAPAALAILAAGAARVTRAPASASATQASPPQTATSRAPTAGRTATAQAAVQAPACASAKPVGRSLTPGATRDATVEGTERAIRRSSANAVRDGPARAVPTVRTGGLDRHATCPACTVSRWAECACAVAATAARTARRHVPWAHSGNVQRQRGVR